MAPEGAWRPGPYFPLGDDQPSVQYKEYERAATANKRVRKNCLFLILFL